MSSTALLFALLSGLIPSFIWLFFWTREDLTHPEPRFLIAATFFAGSISVIVAMYVEEYIANIISDPVMRYSLWAAVEEILKFVAVLIIAFEANAYDEPIDAMIYMIVVALGFAALENMFFLMDPLSHGEIAQSISTGNLRFIGATLLHTVSSAAIGFAIGLTFYRNKFIKVVAALIGLGVAILIHAAFNISIIQASPDDILKTFGWIWGAIIVLIILFEEIKVVRPKII